MAMNSTALHLPHSGYSPVSVVVRPGAYYLTGQREPQDSKRMVSHGSCSNTRPFGQFDPCPDRQVFVSVFDALVAIGEANPKVRQAEALMALSDDELKSRGLKRYEIAHYVFSDSFFA